MQVLSRRTRNNPVLIGEPGVGKTAIVEGLARRIRDGMVPAWLGDSRILTIDAASLVAPRRRTVLANLTHDTTTILCVEGLFNLGAEDAGWHSIEAAHVLEPYLARGDIRLIATGTPTGLRHTTEKATILVRHFEVVEVPPPDEAEAVRILLGLQ